MVNPILIPILWYASIIRKKQYVILIASFLNAFASCFTKIERYLLAFHMFNKLQLVVYYPYLCCSLASFKGFMIYCNYFCYICHVEMQLNDVIKSIGWYRAFVALPIQTDTTKNSTDTDTGIGIGASLVLDLIAV